MTHGDGETTVAQVDEQLAKTLKSAQRLRWWAVVGVMSVMAAALGLLAWVTAGQDSEIHTQNAEIRSSCYFYRGLAGLAPEAVQPGKPPSKLGVQIVAGSRIAFRGQACGPGLPPLPPLVSYWAKKYGIPAS